MALPIAAEIHTRFGVEREVRDASDLFAIGDPAAILAPSHLLGVAQQVGAADMVVMASLGAAQAGRADVGYAELAKRLTEMGLPESEGSVTVKINRGAFPAWFLLAVTKAIGVHTMRLHEPD